MGTFEITQKAFVESMLNRFRVNLSSEIPAAHGVELGLGEEGEPKGDWPCREAVGSLMWLSTMTPPDMSKSGARCGAPFAQPHRQALESSSEDHDIPATGQGIWI